MRREAEEGAPNFGEGQETKEDEKGEDAAAEAQDGDKPRMASEGLFRGQEQGHDRCLFSEPLCLHSELNAGRR